VALRRLGPKHAAEVARRAELAFGPSEGDVADRWRARLEAGAVWGWSPEPGGGVLAHGLITRVEHWFGGRRVPCQNVAGVAIAPEDRGRGAARGLMEDAIRQGAEGGLGLSLLFPATTAMYRALGYEHAGEVVRYKVASAAVPPIGPPMRRGTEADWEAILACAERAGAAHNGPAIRPASRWEAIRQAAFWYVLDGHEGLDAYLLFDQVRDPGDWQYRLSVLDWAATSPRGLEAVVGLIGRHGTIGKEATYRGPVPDTWSQHFGEQEVDEVGGMWWMARGLDLPAAVAARGYAPGLSVDVTFTVDDPLLTAARGPWRLEVAERQAKLSPADAGEVHLDVRAVGPLYTGFRSIRDLALGGLAAGPDEALALLGAAFAGPVPHLLDFF
jgi:predicted acetyltransferase